MYSEHLAHNLIMLPFHPREENIVLAGGTESRWALRRIIEMASCDGVHRTLELNTKLAKRGTLAGGATVFRTTNYGVEHRTGHSAASHAKHTITYWFIPHINLLSPPACLGPYTMHKDRHLLVHLASHLLTVFRTIPLRHQTP